MTTTSTDRQWPASFTHRLTAPLPGPRQLLRALREGAFRASTAEADQIPVSRDGALPELPTNTASITWVGHATFVLRLGGACVLTDPVWSARIPGVPRRLTPPGLAWSALPRVDAVVISHNHYDHLDAATMRRLPRDTPVLVPAGLGTWFRRRRFTAVTELDWWESAEVAGLRFEFVPAHHWSRRTLFDTCRSLWGGWVVSAPGGPRMFHAGDSGYGHFFSEIGSRHPDLDLAMLPVGAYQPRWFMQAVHMDPEEAVRAAADLGAARMATMHWGTFLLSGEPLLEPVDRARKAWREAGRDPADLWDLAVGETRLLPTA
ncbi:membrane protein [Longimycelium tulufanense]|uniref:Membrane protein n=1 Tax=Longimycelium tulufanense TaxID=907463 RepID=A0A8J3CJ23_9PSEU|nr:MBL fold metallo-hydrolase [Longimycelium tulufanense]GGM74144.1 membrane protein [Longimycelium tulufanense]